MYKKESTIYRLNINENAFTLIELLAVIVILAIILAIAIPGISGVIESATKGALESDAKMVIKQLEYKVLSDSNFDPITFNEGNIVDLGLSNDNYSELKIGVIDNEVYIVITGKNKWAGLKACGTFQNINIAAETDMTKCENIPITICSMHPKMAYNTCNPDSLSNFCMSEISLLPYSFTPISHLKADGATVNITGNEALYSLTGSTFGGNGYTNFMLPNLASSVPLVGLNYYIANTGSYPSWSNTPPITNGNYKYFCYQSTFQNYLIGEIKLATNIDENNNNMLLCDGRALNIIDYQSLFAVIGNKFGGNGVTTFQLPNLSAAVSPVAGTKYYMVANGAYPVRP